MQHAFDDGGLIEMKRLTILIARDLKPWYPFATSVLDELPVRIQVNVRHTIKQHLEHTYFYPWDWAFKEREQKMWERR